MILSRTAYCDCCADEFRPNPGDLFCVVGRSGDYYVEQAGGGQSGFVPHFFERIGRDGDNVIIKRTCGMQGCGITIGKQNGKAVFIENHSSIIELSIDDWNALVMNPDLGYHQ